MMKRLFGEKIGRRQKNSCTKKEEDDNRGNILRVKVERGKTASIRMTRPFGGEH